MEVLRAMQGKDQPVGILPGGTGNLLARALGTPRRVGSAVRALLHGQVRTVDLAQLPDGRVFAFAAGMGIDTTMVQRTSAAAKRRFGVLAYAVSAVRAALSLDVFALAATVDGQRHDFRATSVLLANFGELFGGLIRVGPRVRENDGMLDLCVFTPSNVGDALRVGWRLFRHDFGTDPAMHFLQGRVVSLESDPPRQAQADGELLPGTGVRAAVIPGGAQLLAPAAR
jgi:diacylglycerol kinase (ATP)